jgi:hypothetical protein
MTREGGNTSARHRAVQGRAASTYTVSTYTLTTDAVRGQIMDIANLRKAYHDLLAVVEAGGFGPPPSGEWDAEQILAHILSVDTSIASAALAVVSGQRPAYDNRAGLDPWNLRRIRIPTLGMPAMAR